MPASPERPCAGNAGERTAVGGVSLSRLVSIDALRGAAALAVVFHHTSGWSTFVGFSSTPPWLGRALASLLYHCRLGVVLFFVISGFCIHMRRVGRTAGGETPRLSFFSFWKRRLVRLYPSYGIALLAYLALEIYYKEIKLDLFSLYDFASHLLLLHSFDRRTIYSIDGVFWTLAVEEQLYLLYFLLVAARGRFGWVPTLIGCFLARGLWFGFAFLLGASGTGFRVPHAGSGLSHWFTWALGALSVEAIRGRVALPRWCSRPSTAVAFFLAAFSCEHLTGEHAFGGVGWRITWLLSDPLWGLGFFVLVNRFVASEARWTARRRIPAPAQALAAAGLFSYSLYLMHGFYLRYLGPPLLHSLGVPDTAVHRLLFTPLCLAFAYGYYRLFERPFLPRRAQSPQPGASPGGGPGAERRRLRGRFGLAVRSA